MIIHDATSQDVEFNQSQREITSSKRIVNAFY